VSKLSKKFVNSDRTAFPRASRWCLHLCLPRAEARFLNLWPPVRSDKRFTLGQCHVSFPGNLASILGDRSARFEWCCSIYVKSISDVMQTHLFGLTRAL